MNLKGISGSNSNRGVAHATVDISLYVQVITGALSVAGLTYNLPPEHAILKSILLLETLVQVIEFLAYLLLLRNTAVGVMARARYYDWFLTTPTMLLTTIIYMSYTRMEYEKVERSRHDNGQGNGQVNGQAEHLEFLTFLQKNRPTILLLFASNAAMLVAGFFAELGWLPVPVAGALGFAFFALTFATVWEKYAQHSPKGRALFVFLVTVWALYGVAFVLPSVAKNVGFNFLDIVAKNFFGLYLFYEIHRVMRRIRSSDSDTAS
jgi:bacteriorhodopsin